MKQDEIIEMGKKVFLCDEEGRDDNSIIITSHLQAFAKLVAAKEREACAKVCEGLNLYGGSESRQLQRATLKDCAYAIRARGEA